MATESTQQSNFSTPAPSGQSRLLEPEILRRVAVWGLPAMLALLFLAWPYQHWDFGRRQSILSGWARWVSGKADWRFCRPSPSPGGLAGLATP